MVSSRYDDGYFVLVWEEGGGYGKWKKAFGGGDHEEDPPSCSPSKECQLRGSCYQESTWWAQNGQ